MASSERVCFVCKRSILLYKYTDLTRTRPGSSSPKKDIVKQLEVILDCDEKASRRWKYICDPCQKTANEITKNTKQTGDITAIKKEFVAKYESKGVIKSPKKFGGSNRDLSSSTSKTTTSSSVPSASAKRASPRHDRQESKSPDKTSRTDRSQSGIQRSNKSGLSSENTPRRSTPSKKPTVASSSRTNKGGVTNKVQGIDAKEQRRSPKRKSTSSEQGRVNRRDDVGGASSDLQEEPLKATNDTTYTTTTKTSNQSSVSQQDATEIYVIDTGDTKPQSPLQGRGLHEEPSIPTKEDPTTYTTTEDNPTLNRSSATEQDATESHVTDTRDTKLQSPLQGRGLQEEPSRPTKEDPTTYTTTDRPTSNRSSASQQDATECPVTDTKPHSQLQEDSSEPTLSDIKEDTKNAQIFGQSSRLRLAEQTPEKTSKPEIADAKDHVDASTQNTNLPSGNQPSTQQVQSVELPIVDAKDKTTKDVNVWSSSVSSSQSSQENTEPVIADTKDVDYCQQIDAAQATSHAQIPNDPIAIKTIQDEVQSVETRTSDAGVSVADAAIVVQSDRTLAMSSYHDVKEDFRDTNDTVEDAFNVQSVVKVEDETCMSLDEIKEMRLVMDIKAAALREESRTKKGKVSDTQLQAIIIQHKKQKAESDRLRNVEKLRMKEKLKEKLAKRKSRRSAPPIVTTTVSEETKENIQQSEEKQGDHQQSRELQKPSSSSLPCKEDYEHIKDAHAREVTELQQKNDMQKKRQRQELLDKLAERRNKRGNREILRSLSVEEVEEIQSALDQNYNRIDEEKKAADVPTEPEQLTEIQLLQQQLDQEKELMREHLLSRLTNEEESNMTEEDIRQLELYLEERDATFRQELLSQRADISEDEYSARLRRHDEQMQELWNRIDREKIRLKQASDDFKAIATKRPATEGREELEDRVIQSDVAAIQQELEVMLAAFSQEAKELRPLLSDEEFNQLMTHHRRRLQEVKNRLRVAMKREEPEGASAGLGEDSFSDEDRAIDLVKRILNPTDKVDDVQPITAEDYTKLNDDINTYNTIILSKLNQKLQLGEISESEYHRCLKEHQRIMQICGDNMARYQEQLWDLVDSSAEESEETESADGLDTDDEAGPIPVLATTQLWTTPIQQPVVKRVPLREEIPVRNRNQLFKDPVIFKKLDAHAIELAQQGSLVTQTSFSALLNELTRIGRTELEKVRLIFRWITAQNCQYMDLADAIDDTPLGVLKGLYHGKITFATLFTRMCKYTGLQCVEISGSAKLKHYEPGKYVTLEDSSYHHTWNAVRIDGYWYFVDCNWGVSYIPGSVSVDPFRFEYDEHYFLTEPKTMITTHFPMNPAWQLLTNPLTLGEFNNTLPLKPYFSTYAFEFLSHREPVIETRGDLEVQIRCPVGFILFCNVTTVVEEKERCSNGIRFSQYVEIRYEETTGPKTVATCHIRFPEPGHYYATFYAKEHFVDGEINLESQTEICKYYVKCYAPTKDLEPFPEAPGNHWGPIGIEKAGLIPLTHKNAVIECRVGEVVEIILKMADNLILRHELTKNGQDERQLATRSSHRDLGDEVIFTVCPPALGRYGFHIYAVHEGINAEAHLFSYLIIVAEMPIPPPPDGEEYGPSLAIHNLGILSFTHPDPLIQTSEDTIEIVFGLSEIKLTLGHSFKFISPSDGRTRDISDSVKLHFDAGASGSSVTYNLHLKKHGYYQFRLEGKERRLPSEVQNVSLYNYLIKRD